MNNSKEESYVIKTDKGYVKGDLHVGVEFVDKENARVFDLTSLCLYWDSVVYDMFDLYNVAEVQAEEVV